MQLRERLAGLDGGRLLLVAHQDGAGEAERARGPEQAARLTAAAVPPVTATASPTATPRRMGGVRSPASARTIGIRAGGGSAEDLEMRLRRLARLAVDRQDVLRAGGEGDDDVHVGLERHATPVRRS